MARRVIAEAEIQVAANTGPANQDFEELTQAIRQVGNVAAKAAKKTEEAFRDVGRAIDLAMAGGLDGLQNDIRRTIRQLDQMGGAFREVGIIAETSLNDALDGMSTDADRATASLLRLQRQLHDVAQSGRVADRSLDNLGNVSRRVSSHVGGLVTVLGAAGLGYAAFSAAKAGIDMTRQLEKSEAMFLGLTGSVEGAADMLERMVIFARETPYNLASVSEAAAQLLAVGDDFGVTTQNIEQYLTTFGDAITMTGGSEDQFIRIVRVLGQMSSTGKVLGQDMNQLAQNLPGYDVWQTLADGAGTSVQELRRLQDLGQLDNLLSGNEAVQILIDGMEGIPGAAGAMERRMNTLGGAIEKFTETAEFAMVQGLQPFSEELQDALSDPVILRSVEDLSFAFGDLLSKALIAVRPEIDDLAAAGENLLDAFDDWTPILTTAIDALGDFINFVSPFISTIGKMTSAVLDFGDGLGKMGLAAGLIATGNPFGIAGGLVLGVSGALDAFTTSNEAAENSARLLAAAQGEVNTAMAVGKEAVYTEAQQAAINAANAIRDEQGELFNFMKTYGVTITELNNGFAVLAAGGGTVSRAYADMYANIHNPEVTTEALSQFRQLYGQFLEGTDVITQETAKQADAVEVAGADEIAANEERQASMEKYATELQKFGEGYAEFHRTMIAGRSEADAEWGELDEERTEALSGLLKDQADAYVDWAADIDGSTEAAALSLADVADEAENNVRRMIDAINENSIATANWKGNIVYAAAGIRNALGLTDEEAQNFMGTLGELGPESAPALQAMLDNFAAGGTDLQDFFNATKLNAEIMSSSLTEEFDKVTGAAPSLAEGLAEGTLTIEQVLAELPAAMEAAGIDLEAAASMIDASDEMGVVGDEAVNGLVNALSSSANVARVRGAATALGNTVVSGTKRPLKVESPSRVFYEIGEFVVEGLVYGMQSMDDEAYASAVQTASMLTGGIADHFKDADDPQEEARKFAKDITDSIIGELLAEQEAVADAAVALAEAAADALSDAWDRVKDRFKARDIQEAIADAQAELSEARAELASAESLVGAGGAAARSTAEERVARAEAALAAAEATDAAADLIADRVLKDFQRATEDTITALQDQQKAEIDSIQARVDAATRNLDPVARAAAEADLAATKERHEAEMTALERQRDDEQEVLRLRLDNENKVREAAVQAKEDELDAFRDALDEIVDSIASAIEDLPALRDAIGDASRNLEGAFFNQFEELLENASAVDRNLLASVGTNAGLTSAEVNSLIDAALASDAASAGAAAASLGLDQLLDLLSTGLFQIGADGALGIAAGLSANAYEIAYALRDTVQAAISATLASLEIRSPSGVTERLIGEPMAQGIAKGLMSAEGAVSSAMTGLLDNVVGGVRVPSSSQLVDGGNGGTSAASMYRGPLVTMPNAVIQDATDADLVAQRVLVALAATGVDV